MDTNLKFHIQNEAGRPWQWDNKSEGIYLFIIKTEN